MTVAEVARCFQRLYPRLSPGTIPRLRGWRSWNERGRKPAAALGMTSWSGDGASGYVGPKGPTPKAAGALSELPTGARNSRSLAAFGMTVAEVARCFQRLCPRLSPATIPRLRGWRSWNEHGKKPAAALGMTVGGVAKWAAMSDLPTGARNSRSLTAFGMTT